MAGKEDRRPKIASKVVRRDRDRTPSPGLDDRWQGDSTHGRGSWRDRERSREHSPYRQRGGSGRQWNPPPPRQHPHQNNRYQPPPDEQELRRRREQSLRDRERNQQQQQQQQQRPQDSRQPPTSSEQQRLQRQIPGFAGVQIQIAGEQGATSSAAPGSAQQQTAAAVSAPQGLINPAATHQPQPVNAADQLAAQQSLLLTRTWEQEAKLQAAIKREAEAIAHAKVKSAQVDQLQQRLADLEQRKAEAVEEATADIAEALQEAQATAERQQEEVEDCKERARETRQQLFTQLHNFEGNSKFQLTVVEARELVCAAFADCWPHLRPAASSDGN